MRRPQLGADAPGAVVEELGARYTAPAHVNADVELGAERRSRNALRHDRLHRVERRIRSTDAVSTGPRRVGPAQVEPAVTDDEHGLDVSGSRPRDTPAAAGPG